MVVEEMVNNIDSHAWAVYRCYIEDLQITKYAHIRAAAQRSSNRNLVI